MKKTYYKTASRRIFFEEMFEKVGGRCMICQEKQRLVIDHDHKTGFMRGLLCYTHNAGLGMFGDNPQLLRAAATYLETHEVTPPPPKPQPYDKGVILELLKAHPEKSQRAVSRLYAELVGVNFGCAQTRVTRTAKLLKGKELQ